MTKKFAMTEGDYILHREEYDGVCTSWGEITYGSVEPDARDYHCELCGCNTVLGIEEALMGGLVEIRGDSDHDRDEDYPD